MPTKAEHRISKADAVQRGGPSAPVDEPAPALGGGAPDGVVSGSAHADIIDPHYLDSDGDRIDGSDAMHGGAQDDQVLAGAGDDTVLSGAGDDEVHAGSGDDLVDGGSGDDALFGDGGDDTLLGNRGDDILEGDAGNDLLDGGAGDDILHGGEGSDTLIGGQGDDFLSGDAGGDLIDGGAGDDTIRGGAGADVIKGGSGDDRIVGGDGGDMMSGGAGDDLFIGGTAGDMIDGGDGYDRLDLSDSGRFTIRYDTHDPESGEVTFRNADGDATGTLVFRDIEQVVPCFTPGTLIATPKGEVPVEGLRPGDRVITRDNGLQEIRWISAKPMPWAALAANPHLKPVLIRQGSLGNGLPERDMLVSPNHRMLVANDRTALYFDEHEVLVSAKHLVTGRDVQAVDSVGTTYIHFMFDQHQVVLSNGAWSESFQPGDYSLRGVGNAQRTELYELFPELRSEEGLAAYASARRTLRRHEARLLMR
ncbi:MAG: Hint domain-containing protein [Cereibacter changlensis]